ncbi:protein CREG1 isoform X1 [Panthera uncia]|uniref:protein CREG1 isoform X1 n=1 Tax=Panthera uncia TaxID=29064 RepID=UPI0020FF874C|nr:protein CREG1 isoform X1 [Panthera uncia]
MAGRARGSARALLAALLAPALVALLVAPARGRGGRGHGDWDAAVALPPLPPREDAARVARFVTHVCDWGALATLSTDQAVRGWAFADVLSLSDGPPGAGSGVPYFYLSPLQQSVGNLQENPHATLTMSLAQTNFCRKQGFDPQSPLCAHIILSGTVTKVSGYPTRTQTGFRRVSSEGPGGAQSVKRLILDIGSGHDREIAVMRSSPELYAQGGVCLGFSLSLSLCPSPARAPFLSQNK